MCNQTEMWREMSAYDERAARGEVPRRGLGRDLTREQRKKLDEVVLGTLKSRGEMNITPLLTVMEESFKDFSVSDTDIKASVWHLIFLGKIELTRPAYTLKVL
jgi:hypothetical protein